MSGHPDREAGRAQLDSIADEFLARDGVDWGAMFGSTGLRVRGKVFALATYDGELMVKIPEARARELAAAGAAEPVSMAGRTMREWVSMPMAAGAEAWRSLVNEAHAYVDSITPADPPGQPRTSGNGWSPRPDPARSPGFGRSS